MQMQNFPAIVAALVLAIGSGGGCEAAEKKTDIDQIELFQSAERVLVMLKVGAHPPFPVVFDTGTNGNLVDLNLAKRLSLPNRGGSTSIDGATGKSVTGFETFISDARIGGVPIKDARATAFAWDHPNEVGIVGPNSFPRKFVRLDLENSLLTISSKKPSAIGDAKGISYLGSGGRSLPSVDVMLGGYELKAVMDTGNNMEILLPLRLADALALDGPPEEVGEATSAAGTQPVYEATLLGNMQIAGHVFEQPTIIFIKGGPLNIGLPILRSLDIVIEPSKKRSWIVNAIDE